MTEPSGRRRTPFLVRNHRRLQHITFLTYHAGIALMHLNDVAYACVATVRATQNLIIILRDATGVGDVQHSLFLIILVFANVNYY
ncbi:hypothetical protein KCP78_16805 [Salmonella enterica subsp. enterica]|nr:hypothetical protein KCP78_16805 [Salmonella enterica subsp. enterica]